MTDTTPTPRPIHAALAQVALDLGPIGKNERNTQQGFNYRGIETIMAKAGPLLAANGVVVLPAVVDRVLEMVPVGSQGKTWRLVTLTVEFTFVGPDGSTLTARTVGEGSDPGDKASNKAMSAAFKYALLQVLGIADGHDDSDADGPPQDDEPQQRRAQKQAPAKAPAKKAPAKKAPPKAQEQGPGYADAPVRDPEGVAAVQAAFPGAQPVEDAPKDDRAHAALALLNGIAVEDYRMTAKQHFVQHFGASPLEVPTERLDEAVAFAQQLVDEEPFVVDAGEWSPAMGFGSYPSRMLP